MKKKSVILFFSLVLMLVSLCIYSKNKLEGNVKNTSFDSINGKVAVSIDGNSTTDYTFLQSKYYYLESTYCDDGSVFTWDIYNRKLGISSIGSATESCTFDFAPAPLSMALKDNYSDFGLTEISRGDGEPSEYRFNGANPNNYVSFNDEVWRIVGVFSSGIAGQTENRVKLVRNTPFNVLVPTYAWNTTLSNAWDSNNSLRRILNVDYFAGQNAYSSIGFSAFKLIENYDWHLGNVTVTASSNLGEIYNSERATGDEDVHPGFPKSEKEYIGLLYPSDIGYASSSSACVDETSIANCMTDNWLLTTSGEWLLSPSSEQVSGVNANKVLFLNLNNGTYELSTAATTDLKSIRISVYLKENVILEGGFGTQDNPFILKAKI